MWDKVQYLLYAGTILVCSSLACSLSSLSYPSEWGSLSAGRITGPVWLAMYVRLHGLGSLSVGSNRSCGHEEGITYQSHASQCPFLRSSTFLAYNTEVVHEELVWQYLNSFQ